MHIQKFWNEAIKKLPIWLEGTIALILAIGGLILAFRKEPDLYTLIIASLAILALSLLCVYIASAQTVSKIQDGKLIYRFERYRGLAWMGIGFLIGISTLFVVMEPGRKMLLAAVRGPTATPTPTATEIPPTSTPSATLTLTPSLTPTLTPSPSPAPTLTPTGTPVPTSTPIPSPTTSPTFTPTPISVPLLELCTKYERVTVRKGPDESYPYMDTIEDFSCLNFDFSMIGGAWVRIAPDQKDVSNQKYALGWLKTELLESADVLRLAIYVPQSVYDGLYCVNYLSGLKVRECPDQSCLWVGTAAYSECLYVDGRLEDDTWVRIAQNQTMEKYARLAYQWVMGRYLIPDEFLGHINSLDNTFYLEFLPVVTPEPTPQG